MALQGENQGAGGAVVGWECERSLGSVRRNDDGLVVRPAASAYFTSRGRAFPEFEDAREAWRRTPLAWRLGGADHFVHGAGMASPCTAKPTPNASSPTFGAQPHGVARG